MWISPKTAAFAKAHLHAFKVTTKSLYPRFFIVTIKLQI
jgi:hypothetical protein